ncbi:hypothetical protein H4Q26_015777, partial [Puccinia striiformis f. sp. tritici PST-130]
MPSSDQESELDEHSDISVSTNLKLLSSDPALPTDKSLCKENKLPLFYFEEEDNL